MAQDTAILLTPGGLARLEQRLEHLRSVQRKDVADRLRDAQQGGDVAENAEYEDAKNEQAIIESQILDLKRILQFAHVVEAGAIPTDHVGIGSIVKMTNIDTNDEWELTLVSSVEADPDNDLVSIESPVGQAIAGKNVGATVNARVPSGTLRYRIDSIRK